MDRRKITLLLASTLTIMSGASISASLPLIEETYVNQPNVDFLSRLALTAPALLIAVISSLMGCLVDHLGRRNLLLRNIRMDVPTVKQLDYRVQVEGGTGRSHKSVDRRK